MTVTTTSMPCDVLVIGGGPAGLAAACQARRSGAERVLVIERNSEAGGILPQCIHNGFGVRVFGSDLTGPEYAGRWVRAAREEGVELLLDTMVLSIGPGPRVVASGAGVGLVEIEARSLVLAMGCRERPRGALAIPGMRPAGVYTAGTAQRMVNMEGYMPGRRFVILGSGDIGMIMARRLTIEGAEVAAMVEILPYISGLRRNLVQCIRDFDIPLHLCTTVTEVRGRDRVEAVAISQVDERWQPVPGTREEIPCDGLLLSVGLIPENELSRMAGVSVDPVTGGPYVDQRYATSVPGIYAAGNVLHVYDLVDDVTESALRAGRFAAEYALRGPQPMGRPVPVTAGENVRHVVPQTVHVDDSSDEPLSLEFRVRAPLEEAARVRVMAGDRQIASRRVRYVRPSEMLSIDIEAGRLRDVDALQVSVTPADG
ncbi:MAG: NAD(P)/FAD-dependent oxidoreductase [Anaerolineae bacterium]|jgi:NADPH-dependent 2,4-dienoyl-CoA reductase/sulfur reductase-like enzyme